MRTIGFVIAVALAAFGCEKADGLDSSKDKSSHPVAADNTEKNQRDRGSMTLTPGDQGENDVDRGITQKIRQALIKDDALSMTAKNVKIITANGVVTLRGPVKSEAERDSINTISKQIEGVARVDNQLEVAPH